MFRLATDEKTINDLLDVGEDLLTKKLKSNENKTKVKGELKDLKKSKMKLNSRLIGQQQRYFHICDAMEFYLQFHSF